MKKIAIIFVFVLFALTTMGQNFYFNKSNLGIWQSSGNACAGCGNAWVTVTKSYTKNQFGYYEYYIWASTNSFDKTGKPCYSYLNNVKVMYKYNTTELWYYPVNYYTFWIVVGKKQIIYTMYHHSPNASIYVGFESIQPYY